MNMNDAAGAAPAILRLYPVPDQGRMELCAYSRPAAWELQQRFIALATAAGCPGDLSRVRTGTIHSLCRRILPLHGRRGGLWTGLTGMSSGVPCPAASMTS